MGSGPRRVYWDACTWIALILDERILLPSGVLEARGTMCKAVVEAAKKGNVEILTSALNLVEVCKAKNVAQDKIAAFFDVDYVCWSTLIVPLVSARGN
jgi:hypothetical protein